MGTVIAIEGAGLAWDNNASWVGGTKPADGDDIILPGYHEFTSSLTTALNYASITANAGSRVSFSGPLTAGVNNSGKGVILLGETNFTLIGATNKAFAMSPSSRLTLYSGAQTLIEAHNGAVINIESGATFTSGVVRVGSRSSVILRENGGGDRLDSVDVHAAGRMISRRLIEGGNVAGYLEFQKAGTIGNGSSTGSITLRSTGVIAFTNDQAITADKVFNYGGILDPRKVAGVFTLTNYHRGANSRTYGYSQAGAIVYTNAATSDGADRDTSEFSPSIPLD